ncbi:MAG: hypothetical protein OEY36_09085 [Gammaproteobacteria bacterium]|nr:hypothetical protein [Gammaproteobacteria bacterium]
MMYVCLRFFNPRLAWLFIALPALNSCDALNFHGASITAASSFPVVYVKRSVRALVQPVDPVSFVAGGDLYWRDAASASAAEKNLTLSETDGHGDVSSPEISFDGSSIVFSMRRPGDNSWNIWTLDVASKQLTQRTFDDPLELYDDLHPNFLVDGRIVFSSNRQTASRQQLADNNTEPFSYLDPKGRHHSSLLHVISADGTLIKQISFHVGHDRDVALLSNGKLMFSRWEATGQRSHFPLISMNPDGTGIETLYGAYSKGNSFFSPRELPNGNIVAIHAPVSGSHGSGALLEININQFADMADSAANTAAEIAQKQLSLNRINIEPGVSRYGRYLSPYPVFDGSNRILVSWSASQQIEVRDLQTDVSKNIEGDPSFGIYIMHLDSKKMTPVVTADKGLIAYDAIAVQPRPYPQQIDDAFSGPGGSLNAVLEASKKGLLHVRSVYDSDSNDLLGPSMMIATEGEMIAQIAAAADDPRQSVADIAAIKDLSNINYRTVEDRPARFVRLTKPVAVPEGAGQDLIGAAGSVMQQILGYSEVEPDGSVLVKVPADTPLAISVLDAKGRAITNHTSWFQVRPGETLECAGCHSPRRHTALNIYPIAFNNPVAQLGPSQINETMAETRARVVNGTGSDPDGILSADLKADIVYTDVWITDTVLASAQASALASEAAGTSVQVLVAQGIDINLNYGLLTTPAPLDGVINFVEHIQPILSAKCSACHDNTQIPDLRNNYDPNDGVLLSYKNLIKAAADPGLQTTPQVNLKDGAYLTQRRLPYVSVGGPRESSRSSYLIEKLTASELKAPQTLTGATNHNLLNLSEMRLLTEWIDNGANYYNSPYGPDLNSNGISDLSEVIGLYTAPSYALFRDSVHGLLMEQCASCHKAINNKSDFDQRTISTTLSNAVPSENTLPRFILSGDVSGDYRAALAFIEDRAATAQNSLVNYPLSAGTSPVHPQISDGAGGFVPVLSGTDASTIVNWIMP